MARGSTRRSYVRDNRGRFASTGTTGTKAKPAAKRAQRGTNRLTRDNSGKITGVGKNGATARGGRLRTAAGNRRGAVLDRMKKRQSPAGAIRATDVVKAKTHNYMSKMVEKNQARYDNYAIKTGRTPVAENATRRLLAAQSRIAKQDRAKPAARPAAPAAPAKPAKAPRARKAKGSRKIDEAKVGRIADRIRALNARNEGSGGKARIRALNRSEVRQRAVEFLRGKKGVQAVTPTQVAKTINSRKRTSTGKSSGGVLRGKYDNLGQSKLRQQRAERMKSGYDNASIARRAERVRRRTAGRLVPQASANAAEIYAAQLSGRMARGRGAELPGKVRFALQNARNRQRPDGSLRLESARTNNIMRGSRPSYGAPVKGESKRIRSATKPLSTVGSGGSNKANARGRAKVMAKAKMDPMQRSEAAYQKRKHGVSSTIKNPGRPSLRAPRRTTSTGARIAVRGSRAATRQAYRARILPALRQTRTGALGLGVMRKNPRIRAVDTGMSQLSLMGKPKKLKRYKPVK